MIRFIQISLLHLKLMYQKQFRCWRTSLGIIKRLMVRQNGRSLVASFQKKLVFEKGRVATTPFTEPIQALFKITKVLQGSKNKKEVENNLLSTLAPQVRLELTTHGLTVRCSNQLSY